MDALSKASPGGPGTLGAGTSRSAVYRWRCRRLSGTTVEKKTQPEIFSEMAMVCIGNMWL